MTHKPSKFASSFGTEGSQIVSKKGKTEATQVAKASPEPVVKQPIVSQNSRVKSKKSSKKNSARRNENPAQVEEQKAIQQAQFEEVHAD